MSKIYLTTAWKSPLGGEEVEETRASVWIRSGAIALGIIGVIAPVYLALYGPFGGPANHIIAYALGPVSASVIIMGFVLKVVRKIEDEKQEKAKPAPQAPSPVKKTVKKESSGSEESAAEEEKSADSQKIETPKNDIDSSKPEKSTDNDSTLDIRDGLIYGPEAWKIWNVDVVDKVPDAPKIAWDANDPYFDEAYRENYVLLYIPKRIRVKGEEKDLDLTTFKVISGGPCGPLKKDSGGPFEYFSPDFETEFGNSKAPGWVLISKRFIPDSINKLYVEQKQMVEAKKGFHMPKVLEIAILCLMVNAINKEKLYARPYARCEERTLGKRSVMVGLDGDKLFIDDNNTIRDGSSDYGNKYLGVACALRNFQEHD